MQPTQLQAFLSVLQTGSVTQSAEHLHLTQPAISKRLKLLETELGVALFEQHGRRLHPTPAARLLQPMAEQLLRDMQRIRQTLSHSQTELSGTLRIGTSHHIGLHYLPATLRQFVQQHAQVTLDVHFVDSEQAHQAVLAGELDIAFLTLPPQTHPLRHPDLQYQSLWPESLHCVAASFHPLSQVSSLSMDTLVKQPLLLPAAHTFTTQMTLDYFARQQLKPIAQMSSNALEAIRMMVSIGLGWSVLPDCLITEELTKLPLPIPLNRQLGMAWHSVYSQSLATQTLISTFQGNSK